MRSNMLLPGGRVEVPALEDLRSVRSMKAMMMMQG